ncbi:DUF5069 domain-containing protein [Luteolibacter ambystomatis]|uniref:DUF5069 domain-containing protein n=1 Tax=Luteolibacter ambystomatis TaxID=2824561 RepID=A0A975G6U2_9BACT|nr:DUF5069 domain-containing protein [Luteolibacter ambystomatis]QUE50028.1 DUF5069 domain-containing protein [Luteolibacter ambystomatis]
MSAAKDLTKEAPRSPRTRLGGYVILARAIDKGRASIAGTVGEYHFACPLDMMLFDFKGVNPDEVKKLLESGASDQEITAWIEANGQARSAEEVKGWSDGIEAFRPYDNPEKKDWFVGVCAEVGIDPAQSTLFDYLDTDDKLSYAAA